MIFHHLTMLFLLSCGYRRSLLAWSVMAVIQSWLQCKSVDVRALACDLLAEFIASQVGGLAKKMFE